jgi:TrmH family RNA methyltransferase
VSLVVVLYRTQDVVNIAGVVRSMKNFGLETLRLVAPEEFDSRRIQGIAHGSGDFVKRIEICDTLDEGLADCTFVAGMSARQRAAKRNRERPRAAAQALVTAASEGVAALLLGPEDRGLTNEALDRCHRIITIPTTSHAALNLAHALTVMAYELFLLQGDPPYKPPRHGDQPLATREQMERLFASAQEALGAVDFFKTRNPAAIMRTVRELVHRTPLDAREANLVRAMCIEVVRYLERHGIR